MRRLALLGALAVSFVAVAGPAHAATVNVKMQGLHYVPAVAAASIGDTVAWSNAATDHHTVTSDGPTPFDSRPLDPWGGHYSRAFPIAGSFPYYCTIHKSLGMNGIIKVATKVAPTTGTKATDFVVTLAKAGVKPPTGYVFVVQKALGSGAFTTAVTTTATTAHFHAPSTGTYKLRASLQKSTGAVNTNWFSDPVTLTVK